MKGAYWTIQDSSIELSDNTSASSVARNDNYRTKIVWAHFSIQGLLKVSISDQHKASGCKIVIFDLSGVLTGELIHMGQAGLMYMLAKCIEIQLSFSKLHPTMREEIFIC